MTDSTINLTQTHDFRVKFLDCDSGWIHLHVSHGGDTLKINLSHVFEPLPSLLAWLEAIAVGVDECSFEIDEEGTMVMFRASSRGGGNIRVRIEPSYEFKPFDFNLPARQFVGTIYQAFIDFSRSSEYKPQQWEMFTLADSVIERSGLTCQQWVNSLLSVNKRELQKTIWRMDRQVYVDMDNELDREGSRYATDEEVLELTGKPPVPGKLLHFWPLDEWDGLHGDDARRQLLQDLLKERVGSWSGVPWRHMRSKLLDSWLAAEPAEPYQEWRKWVVAE